MVISSILSMTPVSVVIPAFNVENCIIESIESIINQSVLPQEIIIIDDGSTDNTKNILSERYKNNTLIKIVTQNNKGAGEARNYGISLCTGEFIFFCDSDDIVLPGFFEEFNSKLQENKNIDLFCYSSELFYENATKAPKVNHPKSGWVAQGKDALADLLIHGSYTAAPWSYIVRKEIITANNLKFTGRIHEDHNLTMCVYLISQVTYRTQHILYSQRARPGSLTRSNNININFLIDRINAFKSTLAILDKKEYSQIKGIEIIRSKYINWSLFSLIDMCIGTYRFLPVVIIDTFKLFKNNPTSSLKEKILLTSPSLYFFIKKIYLQIIK